MRPSAPTMTRRRALQTAAAAGLSSFFGGPLALARAAASEPRHLRRATYVPLRGQRLEVGGRALRLVGIDDLAGASLDPALAGHPEAFVLTLTGPAGALAAGTFRVEHAQLGAASLFVAPVGPADAGAQRYEIVVDRSVGVPASPPAPAPGRDAEPERPGTPEAAAAERAAAAQELRAEGARLQPVQHRTALTKRAAKRAAAKRRKKAAARRAKKAAARRRRRRTRRKRVRARTRRR